METTVVVRTRDDEKFLARTLSGIREEAMACRVVVMNNNSNGRPLPSDCLEMVDLVIQVPDGSYRPGRVLNRAMRKTVSPLVVFLNADCVPLERGWLGALLEPFSKPSVGATFGRQVARPDCYPPFARDTEDTFGDGSLQVRWRHCFSMAVSAVRRTAWESLPFDERLRYSEDIAWTFGLRQAGFEVVYTPESVVEHSHNYSISQYYKRQKGEGSAEAVIFTWNSWRAGLFRYSFVPLARQVWRDTRFWLQKRNYVWAVAAIVFRLAGTLGRRRGFLEGRAL